MIDPFSSLEQESLDPLQQAASRLQQDPFARMAEATKRNTSKMGVVVPLSATNPMAAFQEIDYQTKPERTWGEALSDTKTQLDRGSVTALEAIPALGAALQNAYDNNLNPIAANVVGGLTGSKLLSVVDDVIKPHTSQYKEERTAELSDVARRDEENFQLGFDSVEREAWDKQNEEAYGLGLQQVQDSMQFKTASTEQQQAYLNKYNDIYRKQYEAKYKQQIDNTSTSMDKSLGENVDLILEAANNLTGRQAVGGAVESIPSLLVGGGSGRVVVAGGEAAAGLAGSGLTKLAGRAAATDYLAGSAVAASSQVGRGALAGALGEGMVMAGGAYDKMRETTGQDQLTNEQLGYVAGIGLVGGAIGGIGGRFQGNANIDLLATGSLRGAMPIGLREGAKDLVKGTVGETIEEGLQTSAENVLGNLGAGQDALTGFNKDLVAGAASGGLMGAAFNSARAVTGLKNSIASGANSIIDKAEEKTSKAAFEEMNDPSSDKYDPTNAYYEQLKYADSSDTEVAAQAQAKIDEVFTRVQELKEAAALDYVSALDYHKSLVESGASEQEITEAKEMYLEIGNEYQRANANYMNVLNARAQVEDSQQTQANTSDIQQSVQTLTSTEQKPSEKDVSDVTRYMSQYSSDDLTALAQSPYLTVEQQSSLRQLAEVKVAQNSTKGAKQVSNDIRYGFKGATAQESNRGLSDYTDIISRAVSTQNTPLIGSALTDLQVWATSHSNKAAALNQAMLSVTNGEYTKVQVAPIGNGEWKINTDANSFVDDQTRKETGTLNVTNSSQKLINSVTQEAELISNTFNALGSYAENFNTVTPSSDAEVQDGASIQDLDEALSESKSPTKKVADYLDNYPEEFSKPLDQWNHKDFASVGITQHYSGGEEASLSFKEESQANKVIAEKIPEIIKQGVEAGKPTSEIVQEVHGLMDKNYAMNLSGVASLEALIERERVSKGEGKPQQKKKSTAPIVNTPPPQSVENESQESELSNEESIEEASSESNSRADSPESENTGTGKKPEVQSKAGLPKQTTEVETKLPKENVALVPSLQSRTQQQMVQERQAPVHKRDPIKAYFDQDSSKDIGAGSNPLTTVADFLSKLSQAKNPNAAARWLEDTTELSDVQRKQLGHFIQFAKAFKEALSQTVPVSKSYVSNLEDFSRSLADDKGQVSDNTATAMALAAYSYLIRSGTKTYNSNEEIAALLRMRNVDDDVSAYAGFFRHIGDESVNVAYDLGRDASAFLGLKSRKDTDPTMQARLDGSLGAWIASVMENMGHIERIVVTQAEMRDAILIDGDNSTGLNLDRKAFTYLRPTMSITEDGTYTPTEFAESTVAANKGTKGFLGKLFGRDIGLVAPKTAKPKSFINTSIRRTDAVVADQQVKDLTKAQQNGFKMRTGTVNVLKTLQRSFLEQLLGIEAKTLDDVAHLHKSKRESVLAKNEHERKALDQGLEWADEIQANEFFDTQRVSSNSRMGYESNLFNVQTSQIHRAMAHLSGFETKINLDSGTEQDQEMFGRFLLAVGEGLEGINLKPYLNPLYRFTTVDKVRAEDYVSALNQWLSQEYVSQATEAMLKALNGKSLSVEDQAAIQRVVDEGGMGIQSLQSLIALAELRQADRSNSKEFTTTIGFSSDGINNGVIIANVLTGVISNVMAEQGGLFLQGSSATDAQQAGLNGVEDYYVTFGNALRDAWNNQSGNSKEVQAIQAYLDLSNFKALRKTAKTWIVPFNYGASYKTLQANLAYAFIDTLYEQLVSIHNESDAALAAQKQATLEFHVGNLIGNTNFKFEGSLLEYEFSKAAQQRLVKAVSSTLGATAKAVTEDFAQEYITVRKQNQFVHGAAFKLYDFLRTHLRKEKEAELREQGRLGQGAFEGLSQQELAQIDKQLLQYAPVLVTALGSQSSNKLESAAQLIQQDRSVTEGGIKVKRALVNKTSSSSSINFDIGVQTNKQKEIGVGGMALAVQGTDAAVSSNVMAQTNAVNVHDAHITGINDFLNMVQKQNEVFFDNILNYSMQLEHVDMLLRTLEGVRGFTQGKPELLKEFEELSTSILSDLKDSTITSWEVLASKLLNDSALAEAAKLNLLDSLKSVHQYGGHGGELSITAQHKAAIKAKRTEVTKRAKALQERISKEAPAVEVKVESSKLSSFTRWLDTQKDVELSKKQLFLQLKQSGLTAQQKAVLNAVYRLIPDGVTVVYRDTKERINGYYEPDNNLIVINSLASGGKANEQVVIHELLHSALAERIEQIRGNFKGNIQETVAAYQADPTTLANLTPDVAAYVQLEALRLETLEQFKTKMKTASTQEKKALAKASRMLSNIDEFISYGLTEPVLQDLMGGLQTARNGRKRSGLKDLFTEFMQSIVRILGFQSKEISTLTAFAHDTARLIQAAESIELEDKLLGLDKLFSRTEDTKQAYEERIQELFEDTALAKESKQQLKVLDSSAVLDLLGYGGYEVLVHEKHAIGDGQQQHPEITQEDWLKVPTWLDNPALVVKQVDTQGFETGKVTVFTGEIRNGKPIIIGLQPRSETGTEQQQLAVTMYAADLDYSAGQLLRGEWLYQNKNNSIGISSLLTSAQRQGGLSKGNGVHSSPKTSLNVQQVKELEQLFRTNRVSNEIKSENDLKSYSENLGITDTVVVLGRKVKAKLEGLVGKQLRLAQGVSAVLSLTSVNQSLENVGRTVNSGLPKLMHYFALNNLEALLTEVEAVRASKDGKTVYLAAPVRVAAQGKVYVAWFKVSERAGTSKSLNVLELIKVAPLDPVKPSSFEDTSQPYYQTFKDKENALRKVTPKRFYSDTSFDANDHVNSMTTLDLLQSLDTGTNTQEHAAHLDTVISSTITQFYNKDVEAKQRIDEIIQEPMSEALASGFSMSAKEQYVQQVVHEVLTTYLETHKGSLLLQQIQNTYDSAKANLKVADLFDGDYSTATPEQRSAVERQHAYLFKAKQDSSHLVNFMSIALTNEAVRALLTQTVDRVDTSEGTWFERLTKLYLNAVAWLADKHARLRASDTLYQRIDQLVDKLTTLDIQARQRQAAWYEKAWGLIGKVTTPLNKTGGSLRYIFDRDFFKNNRFTFVRNLAGLAALSPTDFTQTIPDQIQEIRNRVNPQQRMGMMAELVNEFTHPSALKKIYEKLVRMTNQNAKHRQDVADNTKKAILGLFKNNGKDLSKSLQSALTYALLRTDLQSLLGRYSIDQVLGFVSSNSKRHAAISLLEKEVLREEQGNHMLIRAKQLGHYMVTNQGGLGLVKNAIGIASGIETNYQSEIRDSSDPLVQKLDLLASLYALNTVSKEVRDRASGLIQSERAAVTAMLNLHKSLIQTSQEDFADNVLSYTKGYMPEILNPYREMGIAYSKEERTQMEKEGWKFISVLKQDPMDVTSERYLMMHSDRGYQRYVSGALDMLRTGRKGTEALTRSNPDMLHVAKTRIQAVAIQAKQSYKNFDPSKQEPGLIASYDVDGMPLAYRYEMSSYGRDTYLERNNNFSDLLGAFAGTNTYKPANDAQQDNIAETLHKDYVDNYRKNPRAYVTLSPKATDPKLMEMWRMLPPEFKEKAADLYGKGKPIIVHNAVLNMVFGFKKYSLTEMFDKVADDQNVLEKYFVGIAKGLFGDTAQAKIAKIEHVVQEIVGLAKNMIVIRGLSVLWGNIVSNILMLMAQGINPIQVGKDFFVALYHGRKYQKLNAELLQLQGTYASNATPEIAERIANVEAQLKRNPLTKFIEAGMLSSIVEDVTIQESNYSYTSEFEQKVDAFTKWIPHPMKTAANWLMISPSTAPYQFLATTTQLSDFISKYSLAEHLMRNGQSFEDAVSEASFTFINYDVPTSRGLQYMNDIGLFMFTKFFLRFQAVLAKQLGQRSASVIGQHLAVDLLTDAPGILDPLAISRLGNSPFEGSAASIFGAVGENPVLKTLF